MPLVVCSGSLSSSIPGSSSSVSGQVSNSGPLKHGDSVKKASGLQSIVNGMNCKNSGPLPLVLPTTALIMSGPISSGPLNSNGAPRKVSGPLDSSGSMKLPKNSIARNQAINNLSQDGNYPLKGSLPKAILWSVVLLFVMGFMAGGFILSAVHNAVLLLVVAVTSIVVTAFFIWNVYYENRAVIRFIAQYPDAELQTAKDGQYVKVTGVVTCGNPPLESSYCKVPRCVYTSTFYEYRDWDSKAANPKHHRFTQGLRSMERHVVDFYISMVNAGCGARVTPYVDESVMAEDLAPDFLKWLRKRNISSDDRAMPSKRRLHK